MGPGFQHGPLYWSARGRNRSGLSLNWAGLLQDWDARLASRRDPCLELAGLYSPEVR